MLYFWTETEKTMIYDQLCIVTGFWQGLQGLHHLS